MWIEATIHLDDSWYGLGDGFMSILNNYSKRKIWSHQHGVKPKLLLMPKGECSLAHWPQSHWVIGLGWP